MVMYVQQLTLHSDFSAPTTGNYTIGETVTGSITGISATVEGWNYLHNQDDDIGSIVPSSGKYVLNKNEPVFPIESSGVAGTIQEINFPTFVRNEPD